MMTMDQQTRGRLVVTDRQRQENYALWTAYREGDWKYFGIPDEARVKLRRMEEQKATEIVWEA